MTAKRNMAAPPGSRKALEAYEATLASPHRRPPPTKAIAGDLLLNKRKRNIGIATVREEQTNSALLAWMIRKHLDYVSRFELNFRAEIPDGKRDDDAAKAAAQRLDKEMNGLLAWHARRVNFDLGRRHNRNRWMRLFELNKVVAGDAAGIMVAGSGHMQGLESDQIATPQDWGAKPPPQKVRDAVSDHGLVIDAATGAVDRYCVCARNKHGRLIFDHFEDAKNVVFDGYFTSFAQTRAPSPLLAAMNDVIDLSDIMLYTKVNLKLKNLFGLAVMRDAGGSLGTQEQVSGDGGGDGNATSQPEPTTTLSPDQLNVLDLDANDKIEKFETNSPGANSIEFMATLSRIAMLALDIPFTCLDSTRASFSARIGDWAEYAKSAESKRESNMDVLREIYAWRISGWYRDEAVFRDAANAAGYDVGRLVREINVIPAGTPYMDPLDELKAAALRVSLGLGSIPSLARERGQDAYQIGNEQARYLEWAKESGLPIFYASGGQQAVQNILNEPSRQEPPQQREPGNE